MSKVKTRFAPSPTGYLHIGGLRTALYGYLYANANKGEFMLRIEDTDAKREVAGAVEQIQRSLNMAGITTDGPVEIQSKRLAIYKKHADKLVELGGAYYCFCSKERLEEIKKDDAHAKYDKHCLKLSPAEIKQKLKECISQSDSNLGYVVRQNIKPEHIRPYTDLLFGEISIEAEEIEDGVLLKSDRYPTYNFANVVDDHLMGITHVIRGTEYLTSTPKYNALYLSFGWPIPVYIHLQPIMKDASQKLSKRHGAASFEDFIAKGFLKDAIVNYVALLGWSPKDNREKLSFDELKQLFSLKGLSKSPSIFDEVKLRWLNKEYIKELSDSDFLQHSLPYLQETFKTATDKWISNIHYPDFLPILRSRVEAFGDIPELVSYMTDFNKFDISLFNNEKLKTSTALAKEVLPQILKIFKDISKTNFSSDVLKHALEHIIAVLIEKQIKSGAVFSMLRLALSSKPVSAGGGTELAQILGKEETLRRLEFTIKLLK